MTNTEKVMSWVQIAAAYEAFIKKWNISSYGFMNEGVLAEDWEYHVRDRTGGFALPHKRVESESIYILLTADHDSEEFRAEYCKMIDSATKAHEAFEIFVHVCAAKNKLSTIDSEYRAGVREYVRDTLPTFYL